MLPIDGFYSKIWSFLVKYLHLSRYTTLAKSMGKDKRDRSCKIKNKFTAAVVLNPHVRSGLRGLGGDPMHDDPCEGASVLCGTLVFEKLVVCFYDGRILMGEPDIGCLSRKCRLSLRTPANSCPSWMG